MELRHLRHYLAVVDCGNLTLAAEKLGVAQPAITQSITRMEKLVGTPLFIRSRRGATLTMAGQAILEDVRRSVGSIDAATLRARQIGRGFAGTLKIGLAATAVYRLIPQALARAGQAMPDVEFNLIEMSNAEMSAALHSGDIDLGLVYAPLDVPGRMHQQLIAEDHVMAAVYEGFPIGEDGKVSLSDVVKAGLIFFPHHLVPFHRTLVLDAIRAQGEEPRIVHEASRTNTILAYVGGKRGVSLLASVTSCLGFPGVRFCEIRDAPAFPPIKLAAIWPRRSVPTLASQFVPLLSPVPGEPS